MDNKKIRKRIRSGTVMSLIALMSVLCLFTGIAVAGDNSTAIIDNNSTPAMDNNTAGDNSTEDNTAGDNSTEDNSTVETPSEETPADEGNTQVETAREAFRTAREKYQLNKERYEIAKENFMTAEKRFMAAKEKFRSARDRITRDELQNRAKEYLERAIDQMISHLNVMKQRVENSEKADLLPFDAAANIDEHIAQLEEIRTHVQQAETPQEIRDAASELKEQWQKIRIETQYYIGILINYKIDGFLEKTDNVSVKMDAMIERLQDEGKDTTKLEEYASNFNRLVDDAKETHEMTLDLYESHDGFDSNGMATDLNDARNFLREAQNLQKKTHRTMKAAEKELRHFFNEAKKQNGGKVVVKGTGTLEASGNGKVIIEGDVTVTLSAINGTLIVSNNSMTETNGNGTREELGNGNIKYEGFGSATVSGDAIRVEISGNGIDLKATGTGSAILRGHGTYSTEKDFGVSAEWDKED